MCCNYVYRMLGNRIFQIVETLLVSNLVRCSKVDAPSRRHNQTSKIVQCLLLGHVVLKYLRKLYMILNINNYSNNSIK